MSKTKYSYEDVRRLTEFVAAPALLDMINDGDRTLSPDDMIRGYFNEYFTMGRGREGERERFIFELPLEEMPLHVNRKEFVARAVAKWRIAVGK